MGRRIYDQPLPTLGPEAPQPFNDYELPVVQTLVRYMADPATPPLLTNNEEDLVIQNDPTFFDAVSQASVPHDVLAQLRGGNLTHQGIARKMQIGRNIVRREKADMYAERAITATYASDTCRSLYRVAVGGDFVPVEVDDTVDRVTRRVGDYVTDLLVGGRERRLLRNAAMHRLTDTIRAKFDTDPDAARVLTVLAGQNARKKIGFYAEQLRIVSKDFDRISASTRRKLQVYIAERPEEFRHRPDLRELIPFKAAR